MKILIVGLGMIGSSYAKGLSKIHEVYGVDLNLETIKKAKELGYIIDGSNEAKDFIPLVDLIVLSIYPKNILNFLENNKFCGQVITDVTGVKCHFINDIKEDNFEFIGSHPMAGSEKSGIDACNPEVFKKANFLITKRNSNTQRAVDLVTMIANDLGFRRIKVITPEYHDDVVAFTSQLPHAIACALVNSDFDPETPSNTGDSFRDLTRIASINADLWSELFLSNREYLLNHIDKFLIEMNKFREAIEENDILKLKELFISSKKKKDGYHEIKN